MNGNIIKFLILTISVSNNCVMINYTSAVSDENFSFIFHAESSDESSFVANDWGMEKIDLYDAWDIETGSANVKVGVVDTGIKHNNKKMYMKELDEAIEYVMQNSKEDEVNFVIGSFYVYGTVVDKLCK